MTEMAIILLKTKEPSLHSFYSEVESLCFGPLHSALSWLRLIHLRLSYYLPSIHKYLQLIQYTFKALFELKLTIIAQTQ